MKYRYVPLLRGKIGEANALAALTPQAKSRMLPIIHITENYPQSFVVGMQSAWSGRCLALDGLYNFSSTGSFAVTSVLFTAMRTAGIQVVPSVEYNSPTPYITGINQLLAESPRVDGAKLVVKVPIGQLRKVGEWVGAQGWQTGAVDLVIFVKNVADFETEELAVWVANRVNATLSARDWRSVTLASAAAPKDASALNVGRTDVPRLDWQLWNAVAPQLEFKLDYGDYTHLHPNLASPPGIAMASATVSVRYTVDNDWIVLKGTRTSGSTGQPMPAQYLAHARTLAQDTQFDHVNGCWADTRIREIATAVVSSGNRTTWVKILANRHLSLVADRLP